LIFAYFITKLSHVQSNDHESEQKDATFYVFEKQQKHFVEENKKLTLATF
jgi:hypothetical protein